jgi:hypothetical protein
MFIAILLYNLCDSARCNVTFQTPYTMCVHIVHRSFVVQAMSATSLDAILPYKPSYTTSIAVWSHKPCLQVL